MRYRLEISQPNKMFVVRGKQIRTPLTIDNVTDQELKLFKSKIQLEGIPESKYSIISMDQVNQEHKNEQNTESTSISKNNEEEIYDLDDTEEPFLDSLLDDRD